MRRFTLPPRALALVAALALLATACQAVPVASPSPGPAGDLDLVAHARATADRLDEAAELYRAGATEDALDTVADAYEEHFELIEHPLEEIDEQFMHELELLIAVTIRQQMRDGASVEAVEALVERARTDLGRAEEMLR